MTPVTRETLRDNAFRTLGLSASAGQPAIEAAARKMRIWPDPSCVPSTPWDMPSLGPLRRSKADIELAVALLSQPLSRLEHRMFWFGTDQPPSAVYSSPNRDVIEQHAAAIADVHAAFIAPETADDKDRWGAVVERVQNVCASKEFLLWAHQIEQAGRFEKPASQEEMASKIAELPGAIAAGAIQRAVSALNQGRIDGAVQIGIAVARVPVSDGTKSPLHHLLDRVEDTFNRLADEMEKNLRDRLLTKHDLPEPYFARNLAAATRAAELYEQRLTPLISAFGKLASDDADRAVRIQGRSRDLLVLLALGWEWAGEFDTAEKWLKQVVNSVQGTFGQRGVQAALDRVSPLAAAERLRVAEEARIPGLRGARSIPRRIRSAFPTQPLSWQANVLGGIFIFLFFSGVLYLLSLSSPPHASPVPRLRSIPSIDGRNTILVPSDSLPNPAPIRKSQPSPTSTLP